jgi:hypothetical protein
MLIPLCRDRKTAYGESLPRVERPWLLLLIVPVVIIETIRARAESRFLEEHFGEDDRRHKASTWF